MRPATALIIASLLIFAVGCSSRAKKPAANNEISNTEFKLKKDRTDLETLRKDVPETVKSENDESAYLLSLFQDTNKSPQEISNKFNIDVRRKREEYSKWEKQTREEYNLSEKRSREDFLSAAKKKRDDPSVKKMERDERNRLFQDLDVERRQFFANESDSRRKVDSELRQKRSDFEAQMRDLRLRFDHEQKAYTQTYNDKKKTFGASVPTGTVPSSAPRAVTRPSTQGAPAGFTEEDMKDIQALPKGNKSSLTPQGDSTEE